jgi:Na+/H+ antiporter NhaD/arsenite permease-like protein
MTIPQWISVVALVALYILLLGDWFHRAWVALGLALALLVSGTLPLSQAVRAIDWNTLFLLAGMMVVVACLGDAGLFTLLGRWAYRWSRGRPWRLLWVFYLVTALVSAFLDNVTTVLLLSPIVMDAAEELGINPVPLLMVEVVASNLGGMSTLIGDPPNILIGTAANLSFVEFLKVLGPASLLTLAGLALVLPLMIRMQKNPRPPKPTADLAVRPAASPRLWGLLVILSIMLVLFVAQHELGIEVGEVALGGALASVLYAGGLQVRWWRKIDFGTLGFFLGVFLLVGALESSGLIHELASSLLRARLGPWMALVLFVGTALFSALLDNVPLVAALIPVLAHLSAQHPGFGVELWLAVAMGAAIGGNATVIGASANVVVQGLAQERGYSLSFGEYLRFGAKASLFTALIAAAYLTIRF